MKFRTRVLTGFSEWIQTRAAATGYWCAMAA
jgi:hypothetical protein